VPARNAVGMTGDFLSPFSLAQCGSCVFATSTAQRGRSDAVAAGRGFFELKYAHSPHPLPGLRARPLPEGEVAERNTGCAGARGARPTSVLALPTDIYDGPQPAPLPAAGRGEPVWIGDLFDKSFEVSSVRQHEEKGTVSEHCTRMSHLAHLALCGRLSQLYLVRTDSSVLKLK
jgi:hypothetical protein